MAVISLAACEQKDRKLKVQRQRKLPRMAGSGCLLQSTHGCLSQNDALVRAEVDASCSRHMAVLSQIDALERAETISLLLFGSVAV